MAVVCADAAFALALAVDLMRTPRPDRLAVKRRLAKRAGLSQDFARSVRIDAGAAPAARGLELELFEQFSPAFEVRGRTLLAPRGNVRPATIGVRDVVPRADFGRSAAEARDVAPRADAGRAVAEARDVALRAEVRGATGDSPDVASRTKSELPRGFAAPDAEDPSGGPDVTIVPSSGPIDLVRVYRSARRGVHELGDMRLRLRGSLGLVARQSRLRGAQRVHIEPPLLNLKRTLMLSASERWRDLGLRHLRRRGGMMEFESLRDHVQGDDPRLVDWKAFAKRGKPIVRQFQEERGQEMILVVDCGRRMSATTESGAEPVASMRDDASGKHRADVEVSGKPRTGGHGSVEVRTGGDGSSKLRTGDDASVAQRTGIDASGEHRMDGDAFGGRRSSDESDDHRTAGDATGDRRTARDASAEHRSGGDAAGEHRASGAALDPRRKWKPRPVTGWTKLDHALDTGLQIAAVALQRGDRVGAMAFDSKVRAFVTPMRGSRQLERLRDALFALEASPLESDLERALRELALRHRRRALVLILSDVADPLSIERQRAALATGSRRHKILFATLDDPSLRAAAEGCTPVSAAVRAAACELQEERRQSLRRLARAGARVLDALPAEAAAPLLAAWLEARRSGA